MKVPCLLHVVIDPVADLSSSISLETHPDFQAAKSTRLLETMHIILVAFVGLVEFVGEVGRFYPKCRGQQALVFDQYGSGIKRSMEPLVRIDGDRISQFEAMIAHLPFAREQHATTIRGVHMQPHTLGRQCAAVRGYCRRRRCSWCRKIPTIHIGPTPFVLSFEIASSRASNWIWNSALVGKARSAFRPRPIASTDLSIETCRSSDTYTAQRPWIPSCWARWPVTTSRPTLRPMKFAIIPPLVRLPPAL